MMPRHDPELTPGVLPLGPLNLSSTLSAIADKDDRSDDESDDESRWRGKTGANGKSEFGKKRRGKKGIRDGFGRGIDDDE
jgi:hypothetical protein